MSTPNNDKGASLGTTPLLHSTHNKHPERILSPTSQAGKESLLTAACYCKTSEPCSTCLRFDVAIGAAFERKEAGHE
jgi:hypothetical protein